MEFATLGIIVAAVIVLLSNMIKILKEYERGVVFFLGRFQRVKGPGLIILIPFLQKMTKEHFILDRTNSTDHICNGIL